MLTHNPFLTHTKSIVIVPPRTRNETCFKLQTALEINYAKNENYGMRREARNRN